MRPSPVSRSALEMFSRDHLAENARTPVIKLGDDLHVRIINAATGELLRELTVDPSRNYQPLGRPPGPQPRRNRKPDPDPGSGLSGIS